MEGSPRREPNPYEAPRAELTAARGAEHQPPFELKPAALWKRLAAFLIDFVIVVVPSYVVMVVLVSFLTMTSRPGGSAVAGIVVLGVVLLWLAFLLGYFCLAESSDEQATLGKHVVGIAVVDLNGERISRSKARVRNLAKVLSILPYFLGCLWAFLNKRRRTWHDLIAGTLVAEASELPLPSKPGWPADFFVEQSSKDG